LLRKFACFECVRIQTSPPWDEAVQPLPTQTRRPPTTGRRRLISHTAVLSESERSVCCWARPGVSDGEPASRPRGRRPPPHAGARTLQQSRKPRAGAKAMGLIGSLPWRAWLASENQAPVASLGTCKTCLVACFAPSRYQKDIVWLLT